MRVTRSAVQRLGVLVALVLVTGVLGLSPSSEALTGHQYCPEVTGSISRLYRAYFLREPDEDGFHYWLGLYFSGTSLTTISDSFTRSREYQGRYAGLANRDFVKLVYNNVLGREPDQAGWNYWTDILDRGLLPRGGVMIRFSESPEFVSKTGTTTPLVIPSGTFIYCGSGADVVRVAMPGGGKGAILHALMHGSRNNIVWTLDSDHGRNDLVVNTIGPYSGENLIDLAPQDRQSSFVDVDSSSRWVIQLRPLATAPHFAPTAEGTGDRVLYYPGRRAVGRFTHDGSSNFIVEAVTAREWDLVVNEIGRVDAREVVENAPAWIAVSADGRWSVTVPG